MVFAYDVEASLIATAVLVNSVAELSRSGVDELETMEQLDAFVEEHRYTGARARSEAELGEVRATRPALRELWLAPDEEATAAIVNRMLRGGRALPQLVRHDEWGWHLHATKADDPLASRVLIEAAMGWVDVLRAGELDRMRVCAADDCAAVLVDLSRNRSKRYCDTGNCGNRANVAAYRARRASVE